MGFTKNQTRAIEEHNGNMLVSAAAGSGKTAVLVERIKQEILRKEDPYDIDRILVMTFTKAAAGEMKERILAAINESIAAGNPDRRLYRQAALVSNAHISTIHGFCLDVIRNHFHIVDISPDFRPMDEAEGTLLKQDTLEEILEEEYETGREAFLEMTEHIAYGKNDKPLSDLILNLYKFAVSNPDVNAWFDMCIDAYKDVDAQSFAGTPLVEYYINSLRVAVKGLLSLAERANEICNSCHGPYMYIPAITHDIECLTQMVNTADFQRLSVIINDYAPEKLSSKRDPEVSEELKDIVKELRKQIKEGIAEIGKPLCESVDSTASLVGACYGDVYEIINLTRKFYNRYTEKKKQKNIIDFNDMEHYCLEILTGSEVVADEYRQYFREIYVDEYQDSNKVQDAIVGAIARDNVFMVGDVKQSIYRFRMARPELFMARYDAYANSEGGTKIDLSDNFRSRREVVESVNEIFYKIMHREHGGIEYDDDARLNYAADYYDKAADEYEGYDTLEPDAYKTEFIGITRDSEVDDRELEALFVAKRIEELIDSCLPVYDKGLHALRPVKYSDIAILLRTSTGWSENFCSAIESCGIPVHSNSTTGYFSAPEIIDLIELLKVIDNPLQDIPLAAVMKSPLFGFTDEELAIIRGRNTKGAFYYVIRSYIEAEDADAVISSKVENLLKTIDYYRAKSSYTSVYELLREIIDGEYGRIILACPGGRKKYMNLNMLLSKALDYGNTSYKGLFRFVRYIDYLKKNEIDYGEATISNENDDSVRLLTIHKSKGLEFPIVFVCGMHKQFNTMDSKAQVIPDADYGIGLSYVDSVKRTKYQTFTKLALAYKSRMDTLSEEMRLFYVAMTRAREKLIMTGLIKDPQKELNKSVIIPKAASYLDFLLYAGENGTSYQNIDFKITDVTELVEKGVEETVCDAVIHKKMLDFLTPGSEVSGKSNIEEIKTRLNFAYCFDPRDSFAKVSVSELKKRSMMLMQENDAADSDGKWMYGEEEPVIPLIPAFLSEKEESLKPTVYGTGFHRVLEIWDYSLDSTLENVKSYFNKIKTEKKIESDVLEMINPKDIYEFLCSEIAQRMKRADSEGLLKREQPFVLKDESGMLVQGIIDAYFIEDDGIVLVDYKTDAVKTADELVTRYRIQLDYYAKALERLLKKPIKEKQIYSARLRVSIIIP